MLFPAIWNAAWTSGLVNHLWQSTVVVLIAWLLALALATIMPARATGFG